MGLIDDPVGATPARLRIEALDFVRGAALFGILLMNITAMGLPHQAYNDPTVHGGAEGANLWAWIIAQVGFEGTQRGLFSILFGAGVVLFTSRLEASGRPDAADIYFRRNLWLIGFGLINAWVLLWYGDILYAYGITALFLFAFRKLAARTLLIIGVAVLIANAAWNASDADGVRSAYADARTAEQAKAAGATLTQEQNGAIEAWRAVRAESKPDADAVREEIAAKRAGYSSAMGPVAEMNRLVQSWWMYRFFFDIFGMMIIGMGLFKLGVLTLERRTANYVAMMAGGYAIGIAVNTVEVRWIIDNGFSAQSFAEAGISYDLGRLAMTTGHLGALLLFCRSGALPWFRRSLAAVGQMALTNYLTHSLVALILFFGLGWFGQLERYQLYLVVLAVWAGQLVISPRWLAHYRFGPVEWLWRYLTYGRREPIRRQSGAGPAAAAA